MISTDFAINETYKDAFLSLSLLINPSKDPSVFGKVSEILCSSFPAKKHDLTFFLSGRSALYHLLSSLHVKPTSEILIQGYTCEAVVLPILRAGFTPIFIDIEESTYGMDYKDLEKKITKKSKVLILQHTYGIPPQRQKLIAVAKKHNLIVIEDLAHGFSNEIFINDTEDTIKLLSFGRSKPYSSVFGGAILTTNPTLHTTLQKKVLSLSEIPEPFLRKLLLYKPLTVLISTLYPIGFGKILHKLFLTSGLFVAEITSLEKNGVYDSFTDFVYPQSLAVLLLSQLKRSEETQENRYKNVQIYNHMLKKSVPKHSLIRYPLRLKKRERLKRFLRKKNIFLGTWYDQVVAPKDIDLRKIGYSYGSCPVAEKIAQEIINLPTTISRQNAEAIAKYCIRYEH